MRHRRFIEAASRIKPTKDAVRDEWRIQDVYTKAKATAKKVNFPEKLCGEVYEALVEGCIAREEVLFDKNHEADGKSTGANGSA